MTQYDLIAHTRGSETLQTIRSVPACVREGQDDELNMFPGPPTGQQPLT